MNYKFLLVDDEADMEVLVNQCFRKQIKENIFHFEYASNGMQALEKLKLYPDICLVLTDINMPIMDGLTLLKKINEAEYPAQTVVISAYGDLKNIRTAMNEGAFDFLVKPIDFNDFEITINKSLDLIKVINESKNAKRNTERLELEKEIAMEAAKQKEQFLANMSHEIRTPMNAVMGITNLILKTELNETQYKYVDAIKKSSENLLVIINDILDFSKIEAGKIDFECIDFSLNDVLEGVMSTLRFKAEEKGLELKYTIDNKLPPYLQGDSVRLNQILLNLTGNAVKFTEKGSVTISCIEKNKLEDNKINIEFSVTDTGIGISEDKIDKLFESFTQASSDTTRKYGGTGLGLTISKQLVELQQGSISVKSIFGKGTTFTFEIPYKIGSEQNLKKKDNTLTEQEIALLQNVRVLLAEDNEFNQLVASRTLKSVVDGITVDIANNGKEAVEKMNTEQYDIILMDVQMPLMSGYEATQYIRKEMKSPKCDIPIIALTANVTKPDIEKCKTVGMNDYVTKPFNEYELLSKIVALVNKSSLPRAERKTIVSNPNPFQQTLSETVAEHLTNLQTLHEMAKGDKTYVKEMIEIFIEQTVSSMESIKESLKEKDYGAIASIAHRVRPSFLFMGIKGMDLVAKEIEEIASNGADKKLLPVLFTKLEKVCDKSIEELKEELKKL